jgi:hypothetical protein
LLAAHSKLRGFWTEVVAAGESCSAAYCHCKAARKEEAVFKKLFSCEMEMQLHATTDMKMAKREH